MIQTSRITLVLNALQLGLEVQFKEAEGMTFIAADDGHIGHPFTRYESGDKEGQKLVMLSDVGLNHFIDLCNGMSEDEFSTLAANYAFNAARRGA